MKRTLRSRKAKNVEPAPAPAKILKKAPVKKRKRSEVEKKSTTKTRTAKKRKITQQPVEKKKTEKEESVAPENSIIPDHLTRYPRRNNKQRIQLEPELELNEKKFNKKKKTSPNKQTQKKRKARGPNKTKVQTGEIECTNLRFSSYKIDLNLYSNGYEPPPPVDYVEVPNDSNEEKNESPSAVIDDGDDKPPEEEPATLTREEQMKKMVEKFWADQKEAEEPQKKNIPKTVKKVKYNFHQEIQMMLHAFGDVSSPLPQTAGLLEDLASQYISQMLGDLNESMDCTTKFSLKVSHILQLYKDYPSKQQQIRRALIVIRRSKDQLMTVDEKDLLSIDPVTQAMGEYENSEVQLQDTLEEIAPVLTNDPSQTAPNDEQKDISFLSIDQKSRLQFRDTITQSMNEKEYLYFSNCTKSSFVRPTRGKFTNWLNSRVHIDTKYPMLSVKAETLDIIAQLTYFFLEEVIFYVVQQKFKEVDNQKFVPKSSVTPRDISNLFDTFK